MLKTKPWEVEAMKLPFEVKTDELLCEVAKFIRVPNRVEFEGYSFTDDEVCINGKVDLGYLQLTFMACVNKEGNGYITFQLVPFESVDIQGDYNGDEGVWTFEIDNYRICTKYARYGL